MPMSSSDIRLLIGNQGSSKIDSISSRAFSLHFELLSARRRPVRRRDFYLARFRTGRHLGLNCRRGNNRKISGAHASEGHLRRPREPATLDVYLRARCAARRIKAVNLWQYEHAPLSLDLFPVSQSCVYHAIDRPSRHSGHHIRVRTHAE